MSNYLNLSASDYEKIVLDEKENCIVVVIFNSEEFASNLVYDSILEKLSVDFCDHCKFYKIDTSSEKALLNTLEVERVPSILIYRQGEIQDFISGIQPKKFIKSRIDRFLNS